MVGPAAGFRLLLAVTAAAVPPSKRETAPNIVTLVWMDPEKLLRFGVQVMAGEVEDTFQAAGVTVIWRTDFVSGEDDPLEIVVVARRSPPPEWRKGDHDMGIAFKVNERRRVVYVFLESIRKTLGFEYPRPLIPKATETMLLARGLARVIAHEVVHSIAPGAPHEDEGLMKSRLTRENLSQSYLRFSDRSVRALMVALQDIAETG